MAFEYELKTNSVVDVLNEIYQYLLTVAGTGEESNEDLKNSDSIIDALNKINTLIIEDYVPTNYVSDAVRALAMQVSLLPGSLPPGGELEPLPGGGGTL